VNTRIDFMYRDGANYKQHGHIVVASAPDPALLARLAATLDQQTDFFPLDVGIEPVWHDGYDDDLDHNAHELEVVPLSDTRRVCAHCHRNIRPDRNAPGADAWLDTDDTSYTCPGDDHDGRWHEPWDADLDGDTDVVDAAATPAPPTDGRTLTQLVEDFERATADGWPTSSVHPAVARGIDTSLEPSVFRYELTISVDAEGDEEEARAVVAPALAAAEAADRRDTIDVEIAAGRWGLHSITIGVEVAASDADDAWRVVGPLVAVLDQLRTHGDTSVDGPRPPQPNTIPQLLTGDVRKQAAKAISRATGLARTTATHLVDGRTDAETLDAETFGTVDALLGDYRHGRASALSVASLLWGYHGLDVELSAGRVTVPDGHGGSLSVAEGRWSAGVSGFGEVDTGLPDDADDPLVVARVLARTAGA
jgi:hypothetical protein